ncbi:hypothetical protein ATANTOWER_000163 [Ataeniobius toweri]|uniref:Uncharacterized protein n=1 Tax=Ataeniobius toweri TaxID=208326 RepID=A0ABU7C6J7_9TELE|nr:hypothetical protein [Ataeniobius toweri]
MTIDEGSNADRPVNRELRFLTQLSLHHDRPVQRVYRSPAPHLNFSTRGRTSPPTRRRHSTLFRLKTIASDLEAPILILAVSHSAGNCSSESCRTRADEANRTKSSAKSRDAILRPPKQIPSTPSLRLEILSIKVMNRIGDIGQPWRSPTLIDIMMLRTTHIEKLY